MPAEDALALEQSRPVEVGSEVAHRGADPAAHRQFRRSRSARCRAGGRTDPRAAGRGAARRRRSDPAAGIEGNDRRSCGAARAPASISTLPRIGAAAAQCWGSAAVIRCWGARSPIPTASKGRRQKSRGSDCWRSKPCCRTTNGLKRCTAPRPRARRFHGYEMHMGVTEGPDRARPFAPACRRHGRRRDFGRWPRRSAAYIHGLFADDRQRAAWLARFGAGTANVAYDDRSSARSTRWPRTLLRISISIGCSHWHDEDRGQNGECRDQDCIGIAIERKRATNIGSARLASAVAHQGVVDAMCRHRSAARPARVRARPPSPLPDSRHWASGDAARRAARRATPRRRTLPVAAPPPRSSSSAESREAGRLTRSSSRAAAQPNAA